MKATEIQRLNYVYTEHGQRSGSCRSNQNSKENITINQNKKKAFIIKGREQIGSISPIDWHKTKILMGLNLFPSTKLGGDEQIQGLPT